MSVTIADIRAAAALIEGQVVRTPIVRSGALSDQLGCDIFIKLETLQHTGSFKDRGALVKLKSLTPGERSRGVIAISAGNHAQGVAYHAQRLGIPATIVMPEGTPFNKVRRTQAFGAHVVLKGENINMAEPFAYDLADQEKLTFVHPYDDVRIIAGQGTVGLEMMEDVPDLETIIVPIGGGGIISGVAIAAKAINPKIEIIGVETELYPSMHNAVRGLEQKAGGDSIAEGIAVKSPGKITREIVERLVGDLLVVNESTIESAVQSMLVDAKIHTEGAGATPLAALREHAARFAGKRVGLIACGGNIDPRILASVLMRAMIRAGHMARLRITISDQPGTLARVTQQIGEAGGNIVEIYHQRMFYDVPVKLAELDAVVETRDSDHADDIMKRLAAAGFPTRRLHDSGARN
ncbi:MAG: threonine ammonia-lyase [Alphaproteobacteria bacterium]|nr:threonine ammonia-lyase [Alphaproteobacteria bacterium]